MNVALIKRTEEEIQLAEQLRVALGRLSRLLRLTHVESDLSPSQREVLMAVARSGSLRLSDLAREEGLNPTMLSRIVAKLEERQLIARTPDRSDSRVIHVVATPKALELRDTIRHERTDALLFALGRLSKTDRKTLLAAAPVLETLVQALRERAQ